MTGKADESWPTGTMRLGASAAVEAERFVATMYGAMIAARAYNDPRRFKAIVEAAFDRIRV